MSVKKFDREEHFNNTSKLVQEHYSQFLGQLPPLTDDITANLTNLYILYDSHTDPKLAEWKQLKDEVQKMIIHIKKAPVNKIVVDAAVHLLQENWKPFAKAMPPRRGQPSTSYRRTVLPFCIPYIKLLKSKGIPLEYIFDLFEQSGRKEFMSFGAFEKAVKEAAKKPITDLKRDALRSAFNLSTGTKLSKGHQARN